MPKLFFMITVLTIHLSCGRMKLPSSSTSGAEALVGIHLIDSAINRAVDELVLAGEISDADAIELRTKTRIQFDSASNLVSHLDEQELANSIFGLIVRNYLADCYRLLKCSRFAGPVAAEALMEWYLASVDPPYRMTAQTTKLRAELYSQIPNQGTPKSELPAH